MQQPATHRFGPAASCLIPSELFFAVGFPLVFEAGRPPGSGRPGRPNGAEAFATFAAGAKDSLGSETKARPVGGELAVRRDDAAEVRLLAVEVPSPRGGAERTRLSVEATFRPDERHRRDANLGAAPHSCFVLPSCLVGVVSLVELCTAPPDAAAKISPLGVGA